MKKTTKERLKYWLLFIMTFVVVFISFLCGIPTVINKVLREGKFEWNSMPWESLLLMLDALIIFVFRIIELKNIYSQRQSVPISKELGAFLQSGNVTIKQSQKDSVFDNLMVTCLKYAASEVQKYYGAKLYYEFSVFTDPDAPDIITYYDTHQNCQPTSYSARKQNPKYYEDNGYEAVTLLKNPSTHPKFIPYTEKDNEYSFVNKQQKREIRSQVMFCFHNENQKVLVITCDKKNRFRYGDRWMCEFGDVICQLLDCLFLANEKFQDSPEKK